MDTKRNQTLEEIEENKIDERALPEQSNADKKALENVTASTVDLCVHIDISEAPTTVT